MNKCDSYYMDVDSVISGRMSAFLLRANYRLPNLSAFRAAPFFFFNDPPTPEISPLSLPDALPICIAVGNGAGTNDDCVADHAMGLLIASVRGLVRLDRATRDGVWRTAMPLPPNVSHKRLGILGMGAIGAKIEIGRASCRERG